MAIFGKAKEKAAAKTTKKEKLSILLDATVCGSEKEAERMSQVLTDVATLREQQSNIEANLVVAEQQVKEFARNQWVELYEDMGKNPGTFQLEAKNGASIEFVPSDRYIKIDNKRYEMLKETYGEDIVQESTTYSFDPALLERYAEVIENLITNCPDIAEKDKEKLITASVSFSIKSGTIDNFKKFGDPAVMINETAPVFSLKNARV